MQRQRDIKGFLKQLKDQKELEQIEASQAQNVDRVTIRNNKVTVLGMKYLAQFQWNNLERLELNGNPIRNKGIKILSTMHIPNLKNLSLLSVSIDDEGLIHLSKSQFPRLIELHVGQNHLRQNSSVLCKANFKRLAFLSLSPYNDQTSQISGFALKKLSAANWKAIKSLFLRTNCKVNESQKGKLLNMFPWAYKASCYIQFC